MGRHVDFSRVSHNGTIQPMLAEGLMNKIARLKRREDVLGFAREHAWQPRRGSNVYTFIPIVLERLEAENAQLRGRVAELMLEIQALRDHPRSEIQPNGRHRPSGH